MAVTKGDERALREANRAAIEPRIAEVVYGIYELEVGKSRAQVDADPSIMERELEKFQLMIMGQFDARFDELLSRVVKHNIAAGLTYDAYTAAYGTYEGLLATILLEEVPPGPQQVAQLRQLLKCTYTEVSRALGYFFAEFEREAAAHRRELAEAFQSSVVHELDEVNRAIREAAANSDRVRNESRTAATRCGESLKRAEGVTREVDQVAAATQDLSAAARDLAQQVAAGAGGARAASDNSTQASASITTLSQESARIGEVVHLIRSIAGQTRMLALNATIEAARAGEAGRGFAVVASEVKTLAADTASATDRIAERIEAISGSAREAENAVAGVRSAIETLDEVTASLAAVGEEQSATTNEIARATRHSAEGVQATRSDVSELANFAESASSAANEMSGLLTQVQRASDQLSSSMRTFLSELRGDGASSGPSVRSQPRA